MRRGQTFQNVFPMTYHKLFHLVWLIIPTTSMSNSMDSKKGCCQVPVLVISHYVTTQPQTRSTWQSTDLQQCSGRTDPGTPHLSASNHPPTFFPVTTFGAIFSATFCLWNPSTHYFQLSSLLPIHHELPDSSELFHRSGRNCQLPGQHVSAGLLHLSLWASILIVTMWLWRA